MIATEQIISKILYAKDIELLESIRSRVDDFLGFENEVNFILEHYDKYKSIPDVSTYLNKFKQENIEEVTEPNEYLIQALNDTVLFNRAVDVFQESSQKLQEGDSNGAVELLKQALETDLQPSYSFNDVGIVADVDNRINQYEYANQNPTSAFIPTGFDEIDADIYGLQKGEELVVLYARTNHGKSWISEAICTHSVEQGYNAGYFSPEMSAKDIGYRFDTLHANLSNSAMKFGKITDDFNLDIYRKYGDNLKADIKGELWVTTPKDFGRKLTVSKLKNWCISRNLDIVAIDGITYLTDERFKRGDSKTTSLTNISEDLMTLSTELGIPIIVVVQANRGGVVDKTSLDTPELENIRDSDGIAMNASKVYSIRQIKDANGAVNLLIDNKKMRGLAMGQSYSYIWDIDTGSFVYINKDDIDVGNDESPKREKHEAKGGRRKRKTEEDY